MMWMCCLQWGIDLRHVLLLDHGWLGLVYAWIVGVWKVLILLLHDTSKVLFFVQLQLWIWISVWIVKRVDHYYWECKDELACVEERCGSNDDFCYLCILKCRYCEIYSCRCWIPSFVICEFFWVWRETMHLAWFPIQSFLLWSKTWCEGTSLALYKQFDVERC